MNGEILGGEYNLTFSIGAFADNSNIDGRILLGEPQVSSSDSLGRSWVLVESEQDVNATVYFDSSTYAIAILDEDGNAIDYKIAWCRSPYVNSSDVHFEYYSLEEYAEFTMEEYASQIISPDMINELKVSWGLAELPNFTKLRDDLLQKLKGTPEFYVSGDWQYCVLENGTIEIIGYIGNAISVTIPKEIDGYIVTKLGDAVFKNNHEISKVVLPESIEEIGKQAFYTCYNLTDIQLPEKLSSIGKQAFYNTKIKNIIIPKSVNKIGEQAFAHCNLLNNVDILGNISVLEKETFLWCNHLTSVNISSKLTTIANAAFMMCESLENLEIPSSVTIIGDSAFNGCYKLKNIKVYLSYLNSVAKANFTRLSDNPIYVGEMSQKITLKI